MYGVEGYGGEDELEHLGQAEAELPAHAETADATPLQGSLQQTEILTLLSILSRRKQQMPRPSKVVSSKLKY